MTTSTSANIFEIALREGAGLTYSAMLSAGLAAFHNPLPTDAKGLGLASLALDCHSGAQELCAALLLCNVDAMAHHALPQSVDIKFCATEMGESSAPLASLAIASNRDEFAPLWTMLSNAQLEELASSALPMAAHSDNLPAAKSLLDAGADPNLIDKTGMPASGRCKSSAMLALFAQSGADLRTPIGAPPRQPASTVLDLILSTKSNSAEPKAMREFAAEWARTHEDKWAAPGEDLARLAFTAFAQRNKDSARRCLAALGPTAVDRHDQAGFSMLARACEHENYAEATRLLELGADPYEPTPDGRSPWGMLLSQRGRLGAPSYGDRAGQERASSLCEALVTKRKFRNIPWTKTWPNGWTTLGTLAGACDSYEFALFANHAHSAGLAPNTPITPYGLDAELSLLLSCILNASWCTRKENFRQDVDPRAITLCEKIQIERIDDPAANAFVERFFFLAKAFAESDMPRKPLHAYQEGRLRMPSNRFLTPESEVENYYQKAARAIERGIEARGRLGLPMFAPLNGAKHRHAVDESEYERLSSLYEKGALARVANKPEQAMPHKKRL